MPDSSQPELRFHSGTIPNEVLGLLASVGDPAEATTLVTLWDASIQAERWHEWRAVEAWDKDKLVGACVARVQPGKLASIWPPRVIPSIVGTLADVARALRPPAEDDFEHELAEWEAGNETAEIQQPSLLADRLLQRIAAELEQEGLQLLQTVLPTSADTDALAFARVGFHKLADLLYLQCSEEAFLAPQPAIAETLLSRPYTTADHDLLCEILSATYEETLDCPALNGLQQPADILAGYQQTGQTGTSGWRIFFEKDHPVGCLLMAGHRSEQIAELVYMGLRPEARGQGRSCGMQLVRQAQAIAREWNSEQIVLAVDAANHPARRLYERCGFEAWETRKVLIKRTKN